jgi:hypothetical protein
MSLDLTTLGNQVRQMSTALSLDAPTLAHRIARVRSEYLRHVGKEEDIIKAVNLSREANPWRLFACPYEQLDTIRDVPPCPPDYALVATDGSQIEQDRHGIAVCYLINIGCVYLRYGGSPTARLFSTPNLYYREEDLYLTSGTKRIPVEGTYLTIRRDVQELQTLADISGDFLGPEQHPPSQPALALQDGTLVRWVLAGAEKFVQTHFLRLYLDALELLQSRNIPVASYISRSRSTEVMGAISLMFCPDAAPLPERTVRCGQCSDVQAGREPSCRVCDGMVDADLFSEGLSEGQRSPIFSSMSQINIRDYKDHLIHFFYMRVGREIARVEFPQWVAHDPARVDVVHSLVYDQCVRGQGYPVALARAHEQAVVRGGDRRAFLRMVEESLVRAEVPAASSQKQEHKEYPRV